MKGFLMGTMLLSNGLLALTSLSAQADGPEAIKKAKRYSDIISSSGLEQRKHLKKLFLENFLSETKRYALVKYDLHPGLICATSYLTNDLYTINAGGPREAVYLFEVPTDLNDLKFNVSCGVIPFLTTSSRPQYLEDLMEESVNAIIVSIDEVKRPSSVRIYHEDQREIIFKELK